MALAMTYMQSARPATGFDEHRKWGHAAANGLREQAGTLDTDKNGAVSIAESQPLRQALGVDSQDAWGSIWKTVDLDQDGKQAPREVAQFLAKVETHLAGTPQGNNPFDGVITPREFSNFGSFLNTAVIPQGVNGLNFLGQQITREGTIGMPSNPSGYAGNIFF
ncbi:MAG: hypothetical protein IPK79_06515 [Vampirovibrionales bacterium]|nr:hypothetical protein [Vampirovibrionales bacterium]